MPAKPIVNPLSRRPKQESLTILCRGSAGAGKSTFASSLADAGLGRLFYLDVERKSAFLEGSDGSVFDAAEVEHPDEVLAFAEWAVKGEGKAEHNYQTFVLDSLAMAYSSHMRAALLAKREQTGDEQATLSGEELANVNYVFNEVLRLLCVESGARGVVIVDQIAAKGKEDREENEMGRVMPSTLSGGEFFASLVVEATVQMEGLEMVRVFRVIKSNIPAFKLGMEFRNPTFADFLAHLHAHQPQRAISNVRAEEPEFLLPASSEPERPALTLETVLVKASTCNFDRAAVVRAAGHYFKGKTDLNALTDDELVRLDAQLDAHITQQKTPASGTTARTTPAVTKGDTSDGHRAEAADMTETTALPAPRETVATRNGRKP